MDTPGMELEGWVVISTKMCMWREMGVGGSHNSYLIVTQEFCNV